MLYRYQIQRIPKQRLHPTGQGRCFPYTSKKGCNRMSETHPITTRLRLIIQAQE